jgi:hypothetical protein
MFRLFLSLLAAIFLAGCVTTSDKASSSALQCAPDRGIESWRGEVAKRHPSSTFYQLSEAESRNFLKGFNRTRRGRGLPEVSFDMVYVATAPEKKNVIVATSKQGCMAGTILIARDEFRQAVQGALKESPQGI